MSNKVKWGILGFATIARESFIPALLKASNSEFYALASRSGDKLRQCSERFNYPVKAYSSYDQLLDDPQIEAVYIPFPNSLHKEWTIKAVRKGKHVLCEKPLALNSEDCRQMIEESQRNNVKLMEGFMYRYADRIQKVQKIINEKKIGQVQYIHSYFFSLASRASGDRINPRLGGGALFDLGCYPVNLVGMISGAEPVAISAEAIPINGVDQILSAVLRYENGLIANIHCGWINEFRSLGTTIMGTEGTLTIPEPFWGNAGSIFLRTPDGEEEISVAETDRFRTEIEDFADAIRENRPFMVDVKESIRNLKIIEAILAKAGFAEGVPN
jgi:predicted dehydrogenase